MADQPGVNKNSVCLVGEGGGVVRAVNQRLCFAAAGLRNRATISVRRVSAERVQLPSSFFAHGSLRYPEIQSFEGIFPSFFPWLIEWPRGTASMELLELDYVNVVGLRRMANGDREHCWIEE